jgi:hypothetical protein
MVRNIVRGVIGLGGTCYQGVIGGQGSTVRGVTGHITGVSGYRAAVRFVIGQGHMSGFSMFRDILRCANDQGRPRFLGCHQELPVRRFSGQRHSVSWEPVDQELLKVVYQWSGTCLTSLIRKGHPLGRVFSGWKAPFMDVLG